MTLLEMFRKEFDIRVKKTGKFDIFDFDKYYSKDEDRYKHTIGVASQMEALIKQLGIDKEEAEELRQIALLHDISYSKRVRNRGLNALDSAIFAIEQGLSQDIALAIMFHTAAQGEAKIKGDFYARIYKTAQEFLVSNEKLKKYIELITYANLHTDKDGRPTSSNRRVFKMLANHPKDSSLYKNIKAHKRYFKRLTKKIRTSVIENESVFKNIIERIKNALQLGNQNKE